MKLTILTAGSRGDIQPYIALGVGLKAAGYSVCLATHANFEASARSRGLEFFPVAGDPQTLLGQKNGQFWVASGQNPFAFMRRLAELAEPLMQQMLDDFWRACQDCDAIIFSVLGSSAAVSIAEKTGLPIYPAYLQHVHPTWNYPSQFAIPLAGFGGLYNRLTYILAEQILWPFMGPLINQWRVERLGLPAFSFSGPVGGQPRPDYPFLYGISPWVVPKARDWSADIHMTGYWFLDRPADWQPPGDLVDFLAAGPPPVYVGFGSMTDRNMTEMTETVLDALARTRQRGLLLTGWGGLSSADLPDEVFKIEAAPHDWLFPQVAAVVHHGGAGTTAAGLRAGKPSVLIPFFADQHFWAWRVAQLGAGPSPISRKKLSARRLAAAINLATGDQAMREKAEALGRQIRAEDGVSSAVQILRRYLERPARWTVGLGRLKS